MSIEGARRVMETSSPDVANQYLRFGWKLINHYAVPATPETPAVVQYVLASIRTLEDTREIVTLQDPEAINAHLRLGWNLIDKFVTTEAADGRHERLHFVLAWQVDFKPTRPGDEPPAIFLADELSGDIQFDDTPPHGLEG